MTHCTDHGPDQMPIMVACNRYGLHWESSQLVLSSKSYFSLTAVKMLSALVRCTARPHLSSSQKGSLLSPVASVIRLSISDISAAVDSHTCCLHCNGLKPKASPKRPILPALSLLGLPRCMSYWYGRAINVGISISVCVGGVSA